MNLPLQGALTLRRRSGWEAADAGILLWRDSLGYLLLFFALPLWICAVLLRLIPDIPEYWIYILLWWLKPLFDRSALHILGIRFFEPGSKCSRLVKGLGSSLGRGLAGDLLWRRFSPQRGARLPLRELEQLHGRNYRQRANTLSRGGLNFCAFISCLGLALEGVLLGGELVFFFMIAELIRPDLLASFMYTPIQKTVLFAVYCLNMTLAESLYVSMGFGLYINSRVEAEGWDIQLLFRKFSGK